MGQQQSVTRADFGRSILLLATAMGFDLDDAILGVYWHALKNVPVDVRREAFARASMQKWFRFPQPADLLTLAAQVVEERRQRAAEQARMLMETCGCSPRGWREVECDGVTRLERCACHTRAVTLIAEAGDPIARPQLAVAVSGEGA